MSLFRPYLGLLSENRHLLGVALIGTLLLQTYALASALATQVILDQVIPLWQGRLLVLVSLAMLAMAGVQVSVGCMRSLLLTVLRARIDETLSLRLYRHLLSLPVAFFERRSTGDILMRLGGNGVLRDLISNRALSTVLDGTSVLVLGGFLTVTEPWLGGLALSLGGARLLAVLLVQPVKRDLLRQAIAAQSDVQAVTVEGLVGITTVKAMGMEPQALDRWWGLFLRSLARTAKMGRVAAVTDAASNFLAHSSPVVLLAYAAWRVIEGRCSLGEAFGLLGLAGYCVAAMGALGGTWETWQEACRHIERLREVETHPPEQSSPRPHCGPLGGTVTLQNVSFRYSPDGPLVLEQVNLTVGAGSFVAIVGPSGGGKSTLVKLLVALYEPTDGAVLYGGCSTSTHDLTSLRRQIGCVLQDARLFTGSVRAAIAGASGTLSPDTLERAARLAVIHDEIGQLPLGYDTEITEGGSNLSGGQRQRVAIARAIANSPALLLLDESTSALDARLEARLHRNLAQLGITRIVVTHRLARIVDADQIVVLVGGKVRELGTHGQLMGLGGVYAAMFAGQTA
jgi:ABC-type bacteriocin/lantibiotic exporter with double-glycine peptidase domain